ncbi:hypothetical protein [Kitasatospora sp. NPDC093806]|uniref:hypothetical protein n=1 Tax=Kitasatospora sp. NPDC093806 TaxID=3155075 RepID=UPI00344AABBB
MYSYDVPAAPRRSATASRAIPGMRPSYDAEHPHSATPIYDELYSEYRRLFRALPGDRSGEEDLKFAGFAVRDGYPVLADPRPYPPQHQTFQTYAGQAIGIPQFMPSQQSGPDQTGHTGHTSHSGHTGHAAHTGHHGPLGQHLAHDHGHAHGHGHTQGHAHTHGGQAVHATHGGHGGHPADGLGHGQGHSPAQPATPQAQFGGGQFGTGQGWVAAGYLGPVPQPMPVPVSVPAPMPVTVPVPAPGSGTAFGHGGPGGPGATTGGRHRSLLSLPPGRSGSHH